MMTLRYPLLPQAKTRGSTIYKPKLLETCAGKQATDHTL